MEARISIGITAYNRPETDNFCIEKIKEFAPNNSDIVIIRDVEGIAKAKNLCLAELDHNKHIFLFDSDCYPKVKDWYLPYINSGVKHLSFTFDKLHNGATNGNRILLKPENGLNVFQNPCGCMMYLHQDCLNVIGGMDERFIGYAYDHVNLSQRIHNAGLTPYPFMDVANSLDLLHSMDYYREVQSSVEPLKRAGFIKHNRPIYDRGVNSKEYKNYK